jgi:hypothetical protein
MSLNKITTTDIRQNFNLGAGDIKCNELFIKNLKYNLYEKHEFFPVLYVNNENSNPNITFRKCYFYTTGSRLFFSGNIEINYTAGTVSTPDIYLTLPADFENFIGLNNTFTFCTLNGATTGVRIDFMSTNVSSISLTPINNLPSLRFNLIDESSGGDMNNSTYCLSFECTFEF